MHIRPANSDDVDFICACEARPKFQGLIFKWPRQTHLDKLASSDYRYFLALDEEDAPLGYAIIAGLNSPHGSLELERVLVTQTGQGLGGRLIADLLPLVFDQFGAHRLWLKAFAHNQRALALYEKLGFQKEGIFREAVKTPGGHASLVFMSLLEPEYRSGLKQT